MASDSWTLATSADDDNGTPLIYRIRLSAPAFASKEAFPHLLEVRWVYESPNEQGMPSEDVAARMLQLEHLLIPALVAAEQAFVSVVVTGNQSREWQCYARDRKGVMDLVNVALGELEPFPIQFVFQPDPEWETYNRFLAVCGNEV